MILRKYPLFIILSFFAIVFILISFVNHYCFRTYALDLGMFNQGIYYFSKMKNAIYTLDLSGENYPFLATHFSPLILFFAPFVFIFGSYTLLLLQILFILFGSIGVFKLASRVYNLERKIALLLTIHFLSIWGIYSALSFDFHMNVIGSMCIPWFVYYFKTNFKFSFLFLFMILFSIETLGIIMFFLILLLIIKDRLFHFKRNYLIYLQLIICVLYVGYIILYLMPNLQKSDSNLQFNRYVLLGESPFEMVRFIFTKPIQFLQLFFGNPIEPIYNGIKTETILMLLFSGGLAFLVRPVYLIVLIPFLAIKFLSNDYGFWGINNQYSIEFVPMISLVVVDLISRNPKRTLLITLFFVFTTISGTIITMKSRKSKWYNEPNNNILSEKHYKSEFSYTKLKSVFKTIKEDEIVSSISNFAPHLSFRDKIYHFPIVKDATTIVLTQKEGFCYPLNQKDYFNEIKKLKSDSTFKIFYADETLIIFKKKKRIYESKYNK